MNKKLSIIFLNFISLSFSFLNGMGAGTPGSSPSNPIYIAPLQQAERPFDEEAARRRIEQEAKLAEIRAEAEARAGSRGSGRGMVKGLRDLAQEKSTRQDITSGFRSATEGVEEIVTNITEDKAIQARLERSTSKLTGTLGGASMKGFKKGLQKEVFPEIKEITQGAIGTVFNTRNALQFGLPIAGGAILALGGIYGSRVFWRVLEDRLLNPKPTILLAGSKVGRTDRFKRWWAGYKTPSSILDASVKERLEEMREKTKNIKEHIRNGENITYDNLLLYGNPGTGKTLEAQILADYTDMDFLPVTAASLLQAGVEGIKYFDELLTMANKSKYGTIIFVDEADGLFVDRDSLDPASDHYKVLNHILAATGSGSNKFMLVAATNHAYVMDPAMGRRFQDRILMPLPDENTRKELLIMYMNEQLFNTKTRKAEFVSAAQNILTKKKIDSIAQSVKGLSHAEIKDMVTIMGKKANATKDGIITPRNVETAVAEAIEKKQALERDELQKQRKAMQRQPQYMQPQPHLVNEPEVEGAQAA